MKQSLTRLLALALCLSGGLLYSQSGQPFWSEDFTNNIPANWTNVDASPAGVIWVWCQDNVTNCAPVFVGEDPFNATSASSGFVHVNSDAPGQLAQDHVSRLTTPAIDCSGKDKVYLQFESHIGTFATTPAASALLRVSTDNNTWKDYVIFPDLTTQNSFSENPVVSIIDITDKAANQSTVYLQWQWIGNYEYMWDLDDIRLFDENPTAKFDLAISNFFYPASSFATPASQISTDTFGFFVVVTNRGTDAMTNVKAKVTVEDNDTGEILFSDSTSAAVLDPGVTDTALVMPNNFAPELPEGAYFIRYTISADSADLRPSNNEDGSPFVVTNTVFSKENVPQTTTRTADDVPWSVGNFYTMSAGALDQYRATTAEFTYSTDSTELPITNVIASINLYKIKDDVAEDFSDFDVNEYPGNSVDWVGFADYTAPPDMVGGLLQQVELFDFNTLESGVILEPGARYFLMTEYPNIARKTNHAFNLDILYYNVVSTVTYSDMWYLGGFGDEFAAVLRMYISLVTTTDDKPLPDRVLKLFPNPVVDQVNLALDFDNPTDVTITIADINGRVIKLEDRQGVTKEQVTYQLPGLSSGTYLARIATKEGTKTLQFVVQH
ncbi:MAG: T9SS type A sorting domain-containing protein [Saprospiraceae bacterium]|nr:T9SS type A sorting domain-containing protein [Saprospiraceae bacterium]